MPAFGEFLKDQEMTAIVDYLAARKSFREDRDGLRKAPVIELV